MNKYICNGHEYTYLKDTGILTDNYGAEVAKVELDSTYDGYNYYIDLVTSEVMHSEFSIKKSANRIGYKLAYCYVAFNSKGTNFDFDVINNKDQIPR